jgi:hypothetical protein
LQQPEPIFSRLTFLIPLVQWPHNWGYNMAFFRKKETKAEEAPKAAPKKTVHQSLTEVVRDRVLTAEGWQRRTLSKVAKKAK